MSDQLKIIVSGMIAGDPWQGGATWAVLQYVLGLKQLGHEILLIEPLALKALRPPGTTLAASENASYFEKIINEFDLRGNAALVMPETKQSIGLSYKDCCKRARSADLLLNISGMLTDQELLSSVARRVYLDLDPAFNQLWHAVQGLDMRFAGHTHFVTIGQNLGHPDCSVPTCGITWLKTLQPVVLERWPVAQSIKYDGLTTVANWRGYGSIEYQTRHYGQKAHSLRQLLSLPTLTDQEFMLALAIHSNEVNDLERLSANKWRLLDPAALTGTPAGYQAFVQGSKAEFGIAKSGYVVSRCGWFSDRSACYLASGRPVIAQETGFSRHLPTGAGLFAFENADQALLAIDQLKTAYDKHASGARAIAEEYFDSRKVLRRLLEQLDQ